MLTLSLFWTLFGKLLFVQQWILDRLHNPVYSKPLIFCLSSPLSSSSIPETFLPFEGHVDNSLEGSTSQGDFLGVDPTHVMNFSRDWTSILFKKVFLLPMDKERKQGNMNSGAKIRLRIFISRTFASCYIAFNRTDFVRRTCLFITVITLVTLWNFQSQENSASIQDTRMLQPRSSGRLHSPIIKAHSARRSNASESPRTSLNDSIALSKKLDSFVDWATS